jgi:predicted ATP-grasp superfamily ATP-dependent carboligase
MVRVRPFRFTSPSPASSRTFRGQALRGHEDAFVEILIDFMEVQGLAGILLTA